jgi:hypothetical protein
MKGKITMIPALIALGMTLLIWFIIPIPQGVTP